MGCHFLLQGVFLTQRWNLHLLHLLLCSWIFLPAEASGSPSVPRVIVQWLSCVQLFATPRTAARQASLSFTNSQSLLKLMSCESVMPSNHLILCHLLLLLPSIFASIRVFSSELAIHIRWPKYWSFSFSISPSNEYSGLISFWIDWFDLAVQGTQESSPIPKFKGLSSSASSLLYGPTLTSIHDNWKNHSVTNGPLWAK